MIRFALVSALAVAGLTLIACSDSTTTPATTSGPTSTTGPGSGGDGAGAGDGGDGHGGEPSWIVPTGSGGCDATLYEPPVVASPHVDECSVLEHISNPPTSGPHYPRWAQPKTYDEAIPRGYWVHAMEHGAVVLSYNCPNGCDDEVTAMQAFVDGLDPDPNCPANRILITPDPELDVQFAVSAWGNMLKASCFDETLVTTFFEEHYNDAPEDVCSGGIDPLDPAEMIEDDCGK